MMGEILKESKTEREREREREREKNRMVKRQEQSNVHRLLC